MGALFDTLQPYDWFIPQPPVDPQTLVSPPVQPVPQLPIAPQNSETQDPQQMPRVAPIRNPFTLPSAGGATPVAETEVAKALRAVTSTGDS